MPKKQSRTRKKKKEPEIDLSDLSRAGEHFLTSAAEFVVGTGFAIKGAKDLLNTQEGRQFLKDLPAKTADRGFEFLNELTEQLKEKEKRKSGASAGKRSRKIEVE